MCNSESTHCLEQDLRRLRLLVEKSDRSVVNHPNIRPWLDLNSSSPTLEQQISLLVAPSFQINVIPPTPDGNLQQIARSPKDSNASLISLLFETSLESLPKGLSHFLPYGIVEFDIGSKLNLPKECGDRVSASVIIKVPTICLHDKRSFNNDNLTLLGACSWWTNRDFGSCIDIGQIRSLVGISIFFPKQFLTRLSTISFQNPFQNLLSQNLRKVIETLAKKCVGFVNQRVNFFLFLLFPK